MVLLKLILIHEIMHSIKVENSIKCKFTPRMTMQNLLIRVSSCKERYNNWYDQVQYLTYDYQFDDAHTNIYFSHYNINQIIKPMENIPEQDDAPQKVPRSEPTKTMSRINNTRYLNQNIYSAFLQKRYDECLALLQRSKPDQFKFYIRSLIEKNGYKLEKSLELLNECLVMNRLNYSYLKSIAKNYYLLGKYKSSLEVAKDAYKINPMDHQIFYILGKIALALGDKSTAMTNFRSSIAKEPNEPAYIEHARICMSDNEYVQAADLLKESLNVSNENPQVLELLGICSSKMGRNDNAYDFFKQALQLDAQKYNSLIGMGAISLQRNEVEEALEAFKKAHRSSNNSAALWSNIGIAMAQKGKLVAAYCCLKRALFLDPFRWDLHANLALIFIRKSKYLPAEIHLRSALRGNRDATLFNLLGVCLCELKDYMNAEKALQEACKIERGNEEFQFNLLQCLVKKGAIDKAKATYTTMSRTCNNQAVRDKLLTLRNTLET